MLGFAIKIEKPELESRSSELTRNIEEMKIKLDELEQILLQVCGSYFIHQYFQLINCIFISLIIT